MGQTIYQVDAFADRPFAGNPAAVCILEQPASDAWMQAVALEMNLSETAFLRPRPDGSFDLRWFTPSREVRLCGHATLASAHILWEAGVIPAGAQARFHTLSGLLTADLRGGWIEMDFPARTQEPAEPLPELAAALGVVPRYLGRNATTYLVEVADEMTVRELRPDFSALARLPLRAVMVTAQASSPEFDFVSRFFAPGIGINEDPVTGSAHCYLTPFWSARLHKVEMVAYQASPRGGVVRVRDAGERVILCGQAATVLEGALKTAPGEIDLSHTCPSLSSSGAVRAGGSRVRRKFASWH
jgi:PhzF family phenazine biosynthesis protein